MEWRTTPNRGLDPETQFVEIYRNLATLEFPWDMNQALSFALFRTYAVPSIGRLLDATGEFEHATQKRYDDTSLLLEVPLLEGFESERGKAAVRRINQMHKMYDISNDDMLYVLSTFVVVPKRWIDDYGWRAMTRAEVDSSVRYYQGLGRHLGIKQVPASYDEFADLMDDYERERFAYDPGSRRVADATMDLMAAFYPRPLKRVIDVFSRALMDDPLLDAFHYRRPSDIVQRLSRGGLRVRARVVAALPSRRRAVHVYEMSRIKSYPDGFEVERMGTFAPGCPVRHASKSSAVAAQP
ncbi:oxygenase MpaB family protein [Nocardioides sp.]|uniref:oxygenase MpaB family protein n=1 Tax=Nocardioides sp. TaxID=35761 RepID=UPI002B2700FB|nr:oxygenase MpaB family protein [Nocardioides sp.]